MDGTLTCLGKTDGKLKWRKKISTHPIYADLVAAGDSVLVNDSDLWLRRIGAGGEVLWKRSLLQAFEDEEGRRIFTDVLSGGTYYQSKPTAVKGKVFFGMPSGFLVAADADTGKELWKFEMGGAISVAPAVADGRVFAGQQGGERFFYCVDAETGAPIWKQTIPGGWVWGSAAVDEGRVYVPTVDGHAVCLDAATGHIVWMYPTAKSVPAEPAIDGDLVYFGSWSHSIYAFDKKTGEIVWKENGVGLDSGTLIATGGKVYLPHHRHGLHHARCEDRRDPQPRHPRPEGERAFQQLQRHPGAPRRPRLLHRPRRRRSARRADRLARLLRGSGHRQGALDLPRRRRTFGARDCQRPRLHRLGQHAVLLLPRRQHRQTALDPPPRPARRGSHPLHLPRQGHRPRRRWLRSCHRMKSLLIMTRNTMINQQANHRWLPTLGVPKGFDSPEQSEK